MEKIKEMITKDISKERIFDKIESLLNDVPNELQERWSEITGYDLINYDIDDSDLEDALIKIENLVKKRYEAKFSKFDVQPEFILSCMEEFTELSKDVRENGNFLGEGRVAIVKNSPSNPEIAYKFLKDSNDLSDPIENGIVEEGYFLEQLSELNISGVRVPKVICYLPDGANQVLIQERLNAVSLRDIIERRAELPEKFNIDIFFNSLENFIEVMNNDHNIYHRDLSEGNVMIDLETGNPYVIDFGRSTVADSPEEASLQTASNGSVYQFTESDIDGVQLNKEAMNRFINIK